jgi:uncharacterized iron-regulated membrane protein
MIYPFLIPIVAIIAGTLLALGFPLVRAYARRVELDGQQARVPREVLEQLARMEHAIEATAVEVERISEAQRFTTRLLSESVEADRVLAARLAAPANGAVPAHPNAAPSAALRG